MKQIQIRVPEELKRRIEEEKEKRGLSLNALLIQILWNWSDDKKDTVMI